MAGCGPAFAHRLKGADLRTERGNCGGGDHFPAGRNRRRAELGLSLLLVARRHLHSLRIDLVGIFGRSAYLAGLAAARHRWQSRANADSLRREWGTPSRRV